MSPKPSRDTLEAWLWDLNGGRPRPEDIVVGPLETEESFDDGEIPVEINTTQRFEWKTPSGPGRPISELVEEMRSAGCEIPEPNRRHCDSLCSKCRTVAEKKPSSKMWRCVNCGTRLSRESNKQKNIERFYYFACATAIASYNTPLDGAPGPRGVESHVYVPPRAPEENILEHELQRHADLKRGEKMFQTVIENYSQWSESVSSPFGNTKPLLEPASLAFRMDCAAADLRKAYAQACAGGDSKNEVFIKRVVALAVNTGLIAKELAVYADLELAQETRGRNVASALQRAVQHRSLKQRGDDLLRKWFEEFKTDPRSRTISPSKLFSRFFDIDLKERVADLRTTDSALANRIEDLARDTVSRIVKTPGRNRS